jgi:hypothetical protein
LSEEPIGRLRIAVVSAIILVPMVLQTIASFTITFGPIERPPFLWPFLDYPMYEDVHYPGEPIHRQMVVGILADSSEVAIVPDDLGVDFWQFQNLLGPAILEGDRPRAENYRNIYEDRYPHRLLGFRLEDHPLVIASGGLEEGEPTVLGSLYFESD